MLGVPLALWKKESEVRGYVANIVLELSSADALVA